MKSNIIVDKEKVAGVILVDCREAARLLCVSPRTLWHLTKQRQVPVVRIGRSVRYRVADLETWTRSNTQGA